MHTPTDLSCRDESWLWCWTVVTLCYHSIWAVCKLSKNMCVCAHVCKYVYMCVCVYTYMYTRTHTSFFVYLFSHTHTDRDRCQDNNSTFRPSPHPAKPTHFLRPQELFLVLPGLRLPTGYGTYNRLIETPETAKQLQPQAFEPVCHELVCQCYVIVHAVVCV